MIRCFFQMRTVSGEGMLKTRRSPWGPPGGFWGIRAPPSGACGLPGGLWVFPWEDPATRPLGGTLSETHREARLRVGILARTT